MSNDDLFRGLHRQQLHVKMYIKLVMIWPCSLALHPGTPGRVALSLPFRTLLKGSMTFQRLRWTPLIGPLPGGAIPIVHQEIPIVAHNEVIEILAIANRSCPYPNGDAPTGTALIRPLPVGA